MCAARQNLDVTWTDPKTGIVWVRHQCRSCRKPYLWEVLGEPTPMCKDCESEHNRIEPMGMNRVDRLAVSIIAQDIQYHGTHRFSET